MEPTTLLSTIFGAMASKLHISHLWLLAVAVVAWWAWRDGIFRPLRRARRRS